MINCLLDLRWKAQLYFHSELLIKVRNPLNKINEKLLLAGQQQNENISSLSETHNEISVTRLKVLIFNVYNT